MVDQVRVCKIGAGAIRAVMREEASFIVNKETLQKAMHAVMAALSRNGYAIEDRYGREEDSDQKS